LLDLFLEEHEVEGAHHGLQAVVGEEAGDEGAPQRVRLKQEQHHGQNVDEEIGDLHEQEPHQSALGRRPPVRQNETSHR